MTQFMEISGRYSLLTKNQEIQLGRRIQTWLTHPDPIPRGIERSGRRARDQFVLSNLRLVTKIAKSYTRRLPNTGLTFEDLLQEGVLGLQRAAEKYDPQCGYAYSTYATWWVRQAISRAIEMKGGVIHISASASRKLRKYANGIMQGLSKEEAIEAAELQKRDMFTIERAAQCKYVHSSDALELQNVI